MSNTTVPQEDKVSKAMQDVLDLFSSDKALDVVAHTIIPRNLEAPSAHWSLLNRIMVAVHGTDDARGYRQWQEAKRQVVKGAKSFPILAPRTITREVDITKDDGTTDKAKRTIITGFITIPVFRIEDTEGEPLADKAPASPPPLANVASAWNLTIKYQGFLGKYYGYYNGRQIVLATHDISVFFHELAHAAHARIVGGLKGGQHWDQEIIAEFAAAILCKLYVPDQSFGSAKEYIASYAAQHKLSAGMACVKLLSITEKVIKEILGASMADAQVAA